MQSETIANYDESLPQTISESQKWLEEVETFLLSETYLAFQRSLKEDQRAGLDNITTMPPGSVGSMLLREQGIGALARLPTYLEWFDSRRQAILDHIQALTARIDNANLNPENEQ